MRYGLFVLTGIFVGMAAGDVYADHDELPECPNRIEYADGSRLKYGSTFYYPDGDYLKYGSTLYYPNGNYLKYGSTIYYEDGDYLKYGSTLYYPNGNYLKYGSTFYYQDGDYLKYGRTFYYENGNYARYGNTLYRENGTRTAFPVTLHEDVGETGYLRAYVETDDEDVELMMDDLLVQTEQASIFSFWEGTDFRSFYVQLETGVPGEVVSIRIDDNGADCRLGDGRGGPGDDRFTIRSEAGDVQVQVKPGYSPRQVRRVLEEALDSL